MKTRSLVFGVALLTAAAGPALAEEGKVVRRDLPLTASGRVQIETYKGSITVTAWESPRVEVLARVMPDGDDPDQNEKVRLTKVSIEGSGNSVRIESDYDRIKGRWFRSWTDNGTLPFVHYTIRMPRSATLDIKDYKSRIRVDAIEGGLKLNTYKGSVDLEGLRGGLELNTYKGEVRARFARFDRDSEIETYKGDVSVEMPANARFDLDAEIGRRGDLNLGFDLTTREGHRSGRDGYRGAVNGGGPRLRLETYKGTLRIRER